MLPTKLKVNWPFSTGEEAKNRFLRWPPRIGKILAICDLHVTPMLRTKFQVNWPLGSGEEAKNIFLNWSPWRPSWISDRSDFSDFWSTSHPDTSYQVSSQLAFWFRRRSEKKKKKKKNERKRLSRWLPWRPSWISVGTILTTFDLQVTPMLPTRISSQLAFWFRRRRQKGNKKNKNKKKNNRFLRWPQWQPSWISDWNEFSYF